jgi:hypothetical protein
MHMNCYKTPDFINEDIFRTILFSNFNGLDYDSLCPNYMVGSMAIERDRLSALDVRS